MSARAWRQISDRQGLSCGVQNRAMLGKKKSSKKKKKTASSSQKESAALHDDKKGSDTDNVDAPTLVSGTQTPTGDGDKRKKRGKKKKKRIPRMTKSEKAIEKLEKAMEKLKEDHIFYERFINRMHRWLIDIAPKAVELFKKIDVDGEGAVTTDEFKSGLFDLHVPLTRVELHLLTRLLDADNTGEVDYTHLDQGLELAREAYTIEHDAEADSQMLQVTRRKFPPCPCCKMSIVDPFQEHYPRFISLEFRMVTFDGLKDYPGHFEVLVHSHIPVFGLIQIIIEETQIASTKLAVFRDRTRSRESLLPPHLTLQECGFLGDTLNNPEELVLFYDYTVEFTDCPILLCDHYFGQKA